MIYFRNQISRNIPSEITAASNKIDFGYRERDEIHFALKSCMLSFIHNSYVYKIKNNKEFENGLLHIITTYILKFPNGAVFQMSNFRLFKNLTSKKRSQICLLHKELKPESYLYRVGLLKHTAGCLCVLLTYPCCTLKLGYKSGIVLLMYP